MVAAVSKSEAASTFHISATEDLAPVSGTPFFALSRIGLSGDVDLASRSVRLTATLTGAPSKPGAAPERFSFAIIQIGADSWQSTTGLAALGLVGPSVPSGRWMQDGSSSSLSQIPEPGKLFEALKSNATNVRFVGTAKVDGATCDEYQMVGSAGLLDALGGGSAGQTQPAGPVTVHVWVDGSNLVRRLTTSLQQGMGPPGQVESVALTVDFTDYGEAVNIQPPPANLIVPSS
jgi:hypothetical protein